MYDSYQSIWLDRVEIDKCRVLAKYESRVVGILEISRRRHTAKCD